MAMRTVLVVGALSLLVVGGMAYAQSDAKLKGGTPSTGVGTRALGKEIPQDLRARMDQWYEDCRKSWDAQTRMTKKDYERTCRRMAQERVKFLYDQEKGKIRLKQN
jgi:hypothetical protein